MAQHSPRRSLIQVYEGGPVEFEVGPVALPTRAMDGDEIRAAVSPISAKYARACLEWHDARRATQCVGNDLRWNPIFPTWAGKPC